MKEISLNFSEKCNLACQYCYITHSRDSTEKNEKIIKRIESLEFLPILKDVCGPELETLSLWGAEPTLNLPSLIKVLPDLLKEFPKLRKFSFSSNLSNDVNIGNLLMFIDALDDNAMQLDVQVSVDGPKEIHELNRRGSNYSKVLDNMVKLNDRVKGNDRIRWSVKSTYNDVANRMLLKGIRENGALELRGFIHFLETMGKSYNHTIVMPGNYTKEDGLVYFDLIRYFDDNNINFDLKNLMRKEKQTARNLIATPDIINKFGRHFSCNAGYSTYSLDLFTYDLHYCHHSFSYNDSNKVKNKQDFLESTGLNFDPNITNNFVRDYPYSGKRDNFFEVAKLRHTYYLIKFNLVSELVRRLAKSGLISERYGTDKNLLESLVLYEITSRSCIANNNFSTGMMELPTESTIKLIANGAYEYLYDKGIG